MPTLFVVIGIYTVLNDFLILYFVGLTRVLFHSFITK